MSRQKYPRRDSTGTLAPTTEKTCAAIGCEKRAKSFTIIQFTYMRGEDEGVYHCDEHALNRGHDPRSVSEWCKQFPTEAWK